MDHKFLFSVTSVFLILQIFVPSTVGYAEFGTVHYHTIGKSDRGHELVNSRVMGGSLATVGQIPFQVAVYASNDFLNPEAFCGGVLISSNVVLTAAHCLNSKIYFDVILGTLTPLIEDSYGRVHIKTTQKVIHEGYNYTAGLNNDIGLLILPLSVTYTDTIKPILLPKRSDANNNFEGRIGTTSGWGKIGDVPGFINPDLLYVNIDIIANSECIAAYGPHNIPATKLCISTNGGTQGPCHGDSGGPLFLTHNGEKILTGIVSFGPKQGCESGYPEVYTRITSFLDWIANHGGPAVRT